MAELNERDTKLVQYLNEAYGKEKQLETALESHIAMTTRAPYKKRLQAHLKETKAHARLVERRIKKLGGTAEGVDVPGGERVAEAAGAVQSVARKAVALSQGPLHALRGTSVPEKELKNAKTEYSDEAEEIATYSAIEAFAVSVGDKDTAKLAKDIRREEERMATYLGKLIPQLSKAVASAEVPATQRSNVRRASTRTSASSRAKPRAKATPSRNGASASAASSARKKPASRSTGSRKTTARKKTTASRSRARS
jgi:ferritin-like metal-binding protein YciE